MTNKNRTSKPINPTNPPGGRAAGRRKRQFKPLSVHIEVPTISTRTTSANLDVAPVATNPGPEAILSGDTISPEVLLRHELFREGAVDLPEISSPENKKHKLTDFRLRTIDRDNDWSEKGVVDILQLTVWFESQKNDYNVKEYLTTKSVHIDWIDNPGDDSKDIRARRFQLKKAPDVPESVWQTIVNTQAVVYRAQYECARACQRVLESGPDKNEMISGLESSTDAEEIVPKRNRKSKPTKKSGKKGPERCPVVLHVEVHAHALDKAHIWRRGTHKDADPTALSWSRILHRQAVELSRMEGATAGSIMKALTARLVGPGASAIPAHRIPSKANIENIMPAARRRRQYAKNAFASLHVFAQQNKDKVFLYQPYRAKSADEPERKLMCASAGAFALASALLHAAERGVFMDATWRGMNHNFAPTTFLLGVDENGHATPYAVLLSQDVQASTLEKFLIAWHTKLREFAKSVVANTAGLLQDFSPAQQQTVIDAAGQLVKSRWQPAFFMIDKDLAERKACKKVFPCVEVRVCQFHAIDAIQRWLNSSHPVPGAPARQPGKAKKQFTVPKEAHSEILRAFRFTQRCRDVVDFPVACTGFEAALEAICNNHGIHQYFPTLKSYFEENFWCDLWRDSVTDIGLPSGRTRDMVLSTNNYAESMIKTFKYMFLGMRRNKRVDTLMITITELFFPYYQLWKDDRPRHAKVHVTMTQIGYSIWSDGLVKAGKDGGSYTAYHLDGTKRRSYKVTVGEKPSCTCSGFQQTGKTCAHMWATQLFVNHGNFHEWAESTSGRMNEKSITTEDVAWNDEPPYDDDTIIPVDDNFANKIAQLYAQVAQHGQDGFDATTESLDATTSPVVAPVSPGSPPALQSEFLPNVPNLGARQAPQSPIRRKHSKRSYSEVLSSPPGPRMPSPGPLGESPIFGRLHKRHASDVGGRSTFVARIQESKRRIMAAPLDNEEALAEEDLERLASNFTTWDDPSYQLRIEEANLVADMISQLASTLGLNTIVIADQGDNIANLLQRVSDNDMEDIESLLSSIPSDNALAQLLHRSAALDSLAHILVLRLAASHWTLIDYSLTNQSVVHYDSLPHAHRHRIAREDRQVYGKLVTLMALSKGMKQTPAKWPMEYLSTGHQPVNPSSGAVENLSCGFWTSFYAMLTAFQIPVKQKVKLPAVVEALRNVVTDYQTNQLGGLTQESMVYNFSQFIPNLKARLMHHESLQVWAPHKEKQKSAPAKSLPSPKIIPAGSQASHALQSSQTLIKPKFLQDDERLQLQALFNSSGKTAKRLKLLGSAIPHSHFQSLRPSQWLSSCILDLISLAFTSEAHHIWCTNTSFMALLKESYSCVSRLQPYGKRSVDRISIFSDVHAMVIPFNEPLIEAKKLPSAASTFDSGKSGHHWAVVIIQLQKKQVVYRSSLMDRESGTAALELIKTYLQSLSAKRNGDLGKYQESDWTFIIDDNTPQQQNSHDCGVYVVSFMLSASLQAELHWDAEDIVALRARLAVQIMEMNLTKETLITSSVTQGIGSPSSTQLPGHAFVTVTPHISRKRHMSPPSAQGSSSPVTLVLGDKSKKIVEHPAKRPKSAPFPAKLSFSEVVQSGLAGAGTTALSLEAKAIIDAANIIVNRELTPDDDPDPDDVCPICDSAIPDNYKPEFKQGLAAILKYTQPAKRLANPHGRAAQSKFFMKVANFCIQHREKVKGDQLDAAGVHWPQAINAVQLEDRVQALVPLACQLALDPQTGFAFQPLCAKWELQGRRHCMSPEGMFEASGVWGVAYYGPDGASIIHQVLYDAFSSDTIEFNWDNWGGINDVNYALHNVLMPEVILHLVMEDMVVGEEEAKVIMEASKEYGTIRSRVHGYM